jgi:type II secretory pathway component PulM
MRTITTREKKLIRYSAIGIVIYLALFFIWRPLQHRRVEYEKLVRDAQALRDRIQPYSARAETVQALMEKFQLDPAKLNKATVVGAASAALQKAAMSSGIQVGPVRESPARSANKELASVQFEATGQVPAIMNLLERVKTLGFPMIVDSVQITPEKMGPGMVKLSLTVVILDFDQWQKKEEKPNA